jgi:peptide/nickel transport system substrate-binding protein
MAVLGAPALLAACTSPQGAPQASAPGATRATGGTLTVAWHLDAYSSTLGSALDPHGLPGGVPFWYPWDMVYDRLVTPGDDLSMQPMLATAWQQTSPTTWVFTIRQGVKFSNGRPMTVDDIVGTLQRLVSPDQKNTWKPLLGPVESITATGPSQVTITTKTPWTPLVSALAGAPAGILPIQELKAGSFDPAKDLLGTGPWVFQAHTPNESWTFGRNPNYWKPDVPKADKLIVQIIPDETARLAALRNGTVAAAFFDKSDAPRLLESVSAIKTIAQGGPAFYYLGVNNSPTSIFQDARLRQAVSLAIDREKIVKVALNGVGFPTAAVPAAYGICDPKAMPFGSPDLQAARQLVAAAGATGKSISIIAGTFEANHAPMAQVLQQDLKAIGFGDVSILPLEAGVMIDRVYTGKKADFDLIINWTVSYGDPAGALKAYIPDEALIDKPWLPPDTDLIQAITTARTTPAGAARNSALLESCKRAAQDANYIPLVTKTQIVGFRSDLVAAKIQPLESYADPLRHLAEYVPLK